MGLASAVLQQADEMEVLLAHGGHQYHPHDVAQKAGHPLMRQLPHPEQNLDPVSHPQLQEALLSKAWFQKRVQDTPQKQLCVIGAAVFSPFLPLVCPQAMKVRLAHGRKELVLHQ